jgi:hypothetical protein
MVLHIVRGDKMHTHRILMLTNLVIIIFRYSNQVLPKNNNNKGNARPIFMLINRDSNVMGLL